MKEAMQDDFRQWYMEHKRSHGVFPEFPKEEVWQHSGFKFTSLDNATNLVETTAVKEGWSKINLKISQNRLKKVIRNQIRRAKTRFIFYVTPVCAR